MPTHICHSSDFEEAPPKKRKRKVKMGIRDAVLSAPDFMTGVLHEQKWISETIDKLGILCGYINTRPSRGIKRKIMNVEEMAKRWESLIVGLATAHDKTEHDQWEHDIDDYLTPILSAPVKQIREFFVLLVNNLKANKSVPFFVWRSLEVWQEGIVKNAPDQEVKELKVKLAREIAELVEEDVKRDIGEAVVGALMWRDKETLTSIKKTIVESKKAGNPAKVSTKTKTVGRQSCLFLVVEANGQEQNVML